MLIFPNCKINLGLHILRKRLDGFHDLETVFYPIPLKDALEVVQTDEKGPLSFSSSGNALDISPSENICAKAYNLLKADFPKLPSIRMHLHKTIPSGAGLGGGSADGAFALTLLNNKFSLGLTEVQLLQYAAQLGSDCPFFIKNKPCYATGRGEFLEEIDISLSGYKIWIINPGIHVPTGWAFSHLTPAENRPSLKEIVTLPISVWKEVLNNDFEPAIFKTYPEIANIKGDLYNAGALYAAMSGSGSSVFGIFENTSSLKFSFPTSYFCKELFLP